MAKSSITSLKETTDTTRTINGCLTSSRLMLELWDRSKDNLTINELEWFANAIDRAEHELFNIKDSIERIGCEVLSSGESQSADSVSKLLFTLHHHLDAIYGLVDIGSAAQVYMEMARGQS